ncbi:MAG: NADH-quinone oxidoreductase subunit L, partial [Gallionella sp.]|nr:NADH-quinone oxidoreductase subunit L [Gallionella sp.]
MSNMQSLYLLVPLAPLVGAIAAGLFGKLLGRAWSHRITILLVAVSFFASLAIFQDVLAGHTFNGPVYQWMTSA